MAHKHLFIGRTPTSSVLTCSCGQWRHRSAENAIVEVPDRKALQAMVDDMKRDAINYAARGLPTLVGSGIAALLSATAACAAVFRCVR